MITIREVAELAGVSKSTVSRVLNNNGYVNEDTRKKIEEIIQQYNYSPSASAVNLSRRETNTIGVVIPEIDNGFFGEVLHGITEICDEHDLSMICCDTANNAEKEERALRTLEQQRVRGLIITPAVERTEPDALKRLQTCLSRLDVPVVILDRHMDNVRWDGVYYENFESGYLAAEELIKAGNRELGIITGDLRLRIARDRFQGFMQAAEDAGIAVQEKYMYKGDFTIDTAFHLAEAMFRSGDYPEGIVTCNNRTTLGFIKAAKEQKKQVGKDIALIGIDHINILDILDYNISYVTRDVYEMGRVAMRQLYDRIENGGSQRTVQMVPCVLRLNGSEKRVL